MADGLTILVAARDEAERISATVEKLRAAFPAAELIVADDGSRDATAALAEAAGARVLRLPARGKGQALSLAERAARPGSLLLCDADLEGDPAPLTEVDADLAIAAFRKHRGGGFGIAKRAARALILARCCYAAREPLSGQRALSRRARAACFPVAAGFGCETRMTIDAVRAGLSVVEVELPLDHRASGRTLSGFGHRGRQLLDTFLACGPLAVNHRGLRLPLAGALVALTPRGGPRGAALGVPAIAAIGLLDDLRSGPERGLRAHLRAGRTTGVAKLILIPLVGLATTRSPSGGALVALTAHVVNLLDTKPGRALKSFMAAALVLGGGTRRAAGLAILLAPYDLREMVMLGDAGSNALGAVLGYESVGKLAGRGRLTVVAALCGLSILGEYRSLGAVIETTPGLRALDRFGRQPA